MTARETMEAWHRRSLGIRNTIRNLPGTIKSMLTKKHSDGVEFWQRVEFDDRTFEYTTVNEWVTSTSRGGLGLTMEELTKLLGLMEEENTEAAEEVANLLREKGMKIMTHEEAGKLGGRGNKAFDNVKSFKGGNQKEYLLAKIERDHPEIWEQWKDGEFKSARQAAIAAGIVKVPTPLETAKKAFEKLSTEDREFFHAWAATL